MTIKEAIKNIRKLIDYFEKSNEIYPDMFSKEITVALKVAVEVLENHLLGDYMEDTIDLVSDELWKTMTELTRIADRIEDTRKALLDSFADSINNKN